MRFGLVHVNFETQERTLKDSARFYAEVIASRGAALARRRLRTRFGPVAGRASVASSPTDFVQMLRSADAEISCRRALRAGFHRMHTLRFCVHYLF